MLSSFKNKGTRQAMTTATSPVTSTGGAAFAADLENFPTQAGPTAAWIEALRRRGRESYEAQGLPTTSDEAWRQTNLATLIQTPLRGAFIRPVEEPAAALLENFRYPNLKGPEILFHNGR